MISSCSLGFPKETDTKLYFEEFVAIITRRKRSKRVVVEERENWGGDAREWREKRMVGEKGIEERGRL